MLHERPLFHGFWPWLSRKALCDQALSNLENGIIFSYINDEIKIVATQKPVLYKGGNLVVILSAFLFQKIIGQKDLAVFVNVIYSTISLPPRRRSCHLVIPTRLYPFTFVDIVVH